MKPFSKLKKQIDNLFLPELKMEFCCYSYPMKSRRGNNIPRFCIKMNKEIIWDCPKDFNIKNNDIYEWSGNNKITELVRDYIDTPLDKLLSSKFDKDRWNLNNGIIEADVEYKLTEIFKAADRRLGKAKLIDWAKQLDKSLIVDLMIAKRYEVTLI